MTESVAYASAFDLKKAFTKKDLSPVEVVKASLERAQSLEPKLNSFVTLTPELALDAARKAETAIMRGENIGLLQGLPISVKDLIPVKGVRFTMGSKAMANNIAQINAPVAERVIAAGGCIIGKTTSSEFGAKAVGDSPLTGATRNPWNVAKTSGGSSARPASPRSVLPRMAAAPYEFHVHLRVFSVSSRSLPVSRCILLAPQRPWRTAVRLREL
jgi:Asp-tRNA(Asn)/Glu-tRNA(Gln) amidotransferase A subunit family amidase